jgi:hypothetical protein
MARARKAIEVVKKCNGHCRCGMDRRAPNCVERLAVPHARNLIQTAGPAVFASS